MSEPAAAVVVKGVVEEQLPSALYVVNLNGERRVTAHLAAGDGRNFVRILVGDRVEVALARHDLTRGRIVRKL